VHRTAFSLVTGIPEDKIHVISLDVGGGFGNKVPVYPGYVVATVASVILGVPVKWVETARKILRRPGSLAIIIWTSRSRHQRRARDRAEGYDDGRSWRVRCGRRPAQVPAGMFGIVTGAYDFPNALPKSMRISPTRHPAVSRIAARSE